MSILYIEIKLPSSGSLWRIKKYKNCHATILLAAPQRLLMTYTTLNCGLVVHEY